MEIAHYYLHDPKAPKPNQKTRRGANAYLEYDGKLLLERRWDCGQWGLPGGRMRDGEDGAAGIARELREEAGISLPESRFSRVRVVEDPDRIAAYRDGSVWRMVIVLFYARLQSMPELRISRESRELRFWGREEIAEIPIVATHRDLISEFWEQAISARFSGAQDKNADGTRMP